MIHQYIERHSGQVLTERLFADRLVEFLYSEVRENAPAMFKAITGARGSRLLGLLNFDTMLGGMIHRPRQLIRSWGVDVSECLDDPETLNTPEKLFTRKIRYEECRPMSNDPQELVSPADSRVILGSFSKEGMLFLKAKFFEYRDLLGGRKTRWLKAFDQGDYAIFRLTPEKYHYVHSAVAGRVVDHYAIDGEFHSCNPGAVISLVGPYSRNKRVVTIIDTDVPGGTGCGLVAQIEIVALMVGRIEQCYSVKCYDGPQPMIPGMFVEKGRPKSLFRPGSSTVVVLMQPGRISLDADLLANQSSPLAQSRFSQGLGRPLVETELLVRERIGGSAH